MSGTDETKRDEALVLEFELDAHPEKVWRAVTTAELREHWLPAAALADPEPVASVAGEQVAYRMRDDEPPFLESTVTFRIRANGADGTILTIHHRVADARFELPKAANSNGQCLMLAA